MRCANSDIEKLGKTSVKLQTSKRQLRQFQFKIGRTHDFHG